MSPEKISTLCTHKAVQVMTEEWWNVSFRLQSKHTHTHALAAHGGIFFRKSACRFILHLHIWEDHAAYDKKKSF